MSLFKRELSSEQIIQAVAPSLVRLWTEERTAVGFFVGETDRIVTNLHMIASAETIQARLHGGTQSPIHEVVSLDTNRDLAILALTGAPRRLQVDLRIRPTPGDRAVALLPGPSGEWTACETEVASVHALTDWLTVLELTQNIPEEASGGPLVDRYGRLIGVATVGRADGAPITLGMPLKYLAPLLSAQGGLPLTTLALATGAKHRKVPHYSLTLLEDASAVGLELSALAMAEAIKAGASAYNQGQTLVCVNIYEQVARFLIRERGDCPGVQQALQDGLSKVALEDSADRRAWSLRDTFDGVLELIERWFKAQASMAQAARMPTLRN